MEFTFGQSPNLRDKTAFVFVSDSADVPGELSSTLPDSEAAARKLIESGSFEGKPGQTVTVPGSGDTDMVLIVGSGPIDDADERTYEGVGAHVVKALQTSGATCVNIFPGGASGQVTRIALGAKLASYRFDTYKTKQKPNQLPTIQQVHVIAHGIEDEFNAMMAAADGTFMARDLMNEPPNILHPESFADRISEMSALGLEIEILGEAEMTALGMHALLGVGQGSVRESKLAIMRWNGGTEGEDPVALVGKGVCFDTGGISLKPGPSMEDMKGDMGGAAAVVGAMKTLALRKAKANVVGLVGLVENMPDGAAQRPGDIVTSMSGQTIEIQNTDAEGRLVLCDVLWYTQEKFSPKAIVDLATLTGAIVISLGHHHAGVFTNDDDLAEGLFKAGQAEGEANWRLPLGDVYNKLIDSKFADMRNIGGRAAGSITAAQFLQRFIKDGQAWAHIDIAGVAWVEGEKAPWDVSWASGFGPRLLDRWIRDNYEA